MTRLGHAALLVASVLLVSACAGGAGTSRDPSTIVGPGLVGTAWRPTEVNGQAPPPGPDVTLRFQQDRVSGEAPCNDFSVPFNQDPERGRLQLGPVISTKRACVDEARGALETTWLQALKGDLAAGLDGDSRLDLTASNGTELSLERIR
jgi:heat shock protein HslJ